MTSAELQAAILATQKQIRDTMSPLRKRDLQRHLARLRRKLRAFMMQPADESNNQQTE